MNYKRVAYGKLKKRVGIVDGLSDFGVKVVQVVYLRPPGYGYKKGRGKK